MNVLVCDDDKEIVNAIEIYLENEGYTIFKAFNGEEALEVIKDHEIHLILMDIMMPKMGGMKATMKIREKIMSHSSCFLPNRRIRIKLLG